MLSLLDPNMSGQRSLDLADNFVLSSGTVSIDLSSGRVLLLHHRPTGEILLPKGRKNVGETLEEAAVRETFEESGHPCRLLQHNLGTNAPNPRRLGYHEEPIAIQQRMSDGIRKFIFWYIARVDSSVIPAANTQEDGEDFEVRWAPKRDAASMMSFADDRDVVAKAVAVVSTFTNPTRAALASLIQTAYLDPAIDPRELGFLSISIGGSIVHDESKISTLQDLEPKDWGGMGIVNSKKDILSLLLEKQPLLCQLLKLHSMESPLPSVKVDLVGFPLRHYANDLLG